MTGDRSGESRWLSTMGRQKVHSPMLQKFRLSPPRLKSSSGDKDLRISLPPQSSLPCGGDEPKQSSSDSSVTSTLSVVVIKEWAIAVLNRGCPAHHWTANCEEPTGSFFLRSYVKSAGGPPKESWDMRTLIDQTNIWSYHRDVSALHSSTHSFPWNVPWLSHTTTCIHLISLRAKVDLVTEKQLCQKSVVAQTKW